MYVGYMHAEYLLTATATVIGTCHKNSPHVTLEGGTARI
jgi:hypothetical protein